jgi:hypothetical protein
MTLHKLTAKEKQSYALQEIALSFYYLVLKFGLRN